MREVLKIFAGCIILSFCMLATRAQTPVTNTTFYKGYLDFKIVRIAEDTGTVNDEIAEYLLSDKIAPDLKAAIVNAMSFEILGKDNASIFKKYLAEKYQKEAFDPTLLDSMTASELLSLGYMLAMDDYMLPGRALKYVEMAREKMPSDHAVNVIHAILQAQEVYADHKCQALVIMQTLPPREQMTDLMLEEGMNILEGYVRSLEKTCEKK